MTRTLPIERSPEEGVRHRRAQWCAKWMRVSFFVALLPFGLAWWMAATNLANPALPAVAALAVLANLTSAVIIRMARRVAPTRFPVRWRGKAGNVGGFGTHLLLTFMSALILKLAI
ncbi:hypothetical protein [Asanoa siamensis]|uniref:Uncharacterized protein n=1 Tax=Asanoa siamensis TaxID=926357 RepID=A0ABQ4CUN2_9ACTN|nr:hypothetical protein [Asanoa siamensis]GIF74994.1 hypothetical protein Asi02nite_45120 [Asanoa siamensis]